MQHISTIEQFAELTHNINNLRFYVNIISVAQSGMSRKMRFYIALNNNMINITDFLSKYLKYTFHKKSHSIIVRGYGMDMVFVVLNNLKQQIQHESANMADLQKLQNIKINANNYHVI